MSVVPLQAVETKQKVMMEDLISPYCVSRSGKTVVRYSRNAHDVDEKIELLSCITNNNVIRIWHTNDGTITADVRGSSNSSYILTNVKNVPIIKDRHFITDFSGTKRMDFAVTIGVADEFDSTIQVTFENQSNLNDFIQKMRLLIKYWEYQHIPREEEVGDNLPLINFDYEPIQKIAKLNKDNDDNMMQIKLDIIEETSRQLDKQTKTNDEIAEYIKEITVAELKKRDVGNVVDYFKKQMLFLQEEMKLQDDYEIYMQKHYKKTRLIRNTTAQYDTIMKFSKCLFDQINGQQNIDDKKKKLLDDILTKGEQNFKRIQVENDKKICHLFVVQRLNQKLRQYKLINEKTDRSIRFVKINEKYLDIVIEIVKEYIEEVQIDHLKLRRKDMEIKNGYFDQLMKKTSEMLQNGSFRRYWAEL